PTAPAPLRRRMPVRQVRRAVPGSSPAPELPVNRLTAGQATARPAPTASCQARVWLVKYAAASPCATALTDHLKVSTRVGMRTRRAAVVNPSPPASVSGESAVLRRIARTSRYAPTSAAGQRK